MLQHATGAPAASGKTAHHPAARWRELWRIFVVAVLATVALAAPPAIAQSPVSGATVVSAGGGHTCIVAAGGAAKCWGANANGQVGDNSTTQRLVVTDVSGLASGATAISAGALHTCALVSGGMKCWGANGSGQLGDDTNLQRLVPVDVTGLGSGVAKIVARGSHTCAVTTGGGLKCWGFNGSGQIGDNSFQNRDVPVDVVGLTSGVAAVTAGVSHTCAVTTGSGLKCWGDNFSGQLGDDTNVGKQTPVDVSGLTSGVAAVSAGGLHTCALTTGGGVKCWGQNEHGQLGDGTTDIRDVPVDVTGLTSGVAAISVGNEFSCALTTGGGVKCWGFNEAGQIGDNSMDDRLTPVDVTGLTSGVSAIAAGDAHACALVTGGGVKCWGLNTTGSLGDNSTTTSLVPVSVLQAGVPGAPVIGMATAGVQQASVTFGAPMSDGGSPITGYTVTASPAAGVDSNAGSTSTTHIVTGLTAGVSYTFTVTATNAVGTGAPSAPSNAVVPTGPTITVNPTSVPGGTVAVAYVTQNLTGSGGTGPYTFAVTAGALPGGLTLTPAGVLSGTPNAAGMFNFTVTATDSSSMGVGGPFTGSRAYSGTIAQGSQTISFGPLSNRVFGSGTFEVSATATSGLTVSFSSQTMSVCTVSGTTVTLVATGGCTIRASQAGNANWNPAPNVDQSFTVTPPPITVNPTTVPNGTVGVLYAQQQLSATGATGPYTFAVTAGALPGGLTLTPGGLLSGTPNAAGVFNFTVTATDSSSAGVGGPFTGSRAYSSTIAQGSQTISFGPLSNKVLGSGTFEVSATATSGLAVSFSSQTVAVCTVSGTTVTLVTTGTCTIRASQAGNANWLAAPNVDQSFTVTAPPIVVNPASVPNGTVGVVYATQNLSGTGGTPPYTFAVTAGALPGGLTLTPAGGLSGTPNAAGLFNFTVTATDSTPMGSGGPITGSRAYSSTIAMGSQTITFAALSNKVFGSGTFEVSATATSGLTVSFSSQTMSVCTVSGTTVTLVATGGCTIRASQAGNANWNPAPNVDQSFTVTPPPITVNPATVPNGTVGVLYAQQQLTGSGATGPYTFAVTAGALPGGLTLSPAGVLSGTPNAVGTFNFTVTATDSSGAGVGGPFTGSRAYSSTIAQGSQTITFGMLAAKVLGSPPFGVSATASSGLAVSFSSQTLPVCTVSGSTVTLVAVGTCTIRASQAGNANWLAAPNVDQSFMVSASPITVNPMTVPGGTVGVVYATQNLSGSGGTDPYTFAVTAGTLPGGLTLTPGGVLSGTPNAAGTFNFTVAATDSTPGGSGGPFTGTRAYSSTIAPGSQTISFGMLSNKVLGSAPFGVSATATSTLAVTFSSQTMSNCSVEGSTVTLLAVGQCTIRASQAGDANWNPAPNVDQSFMITAPPITVSPPALPDGTFNTVYPTQNLSASGATPPYTFAVTMGALPNGLNLTPAGVLSGTPTAAGEFSFTVTVTDSTPMGSGGPITGTWNYAVTIAPANQTISFGPLANRIIGSADFEVSATATSGLTVTFSSQTMATCTVAGTTVTLVATGTCTIRASQAGNANWNAAIDVDQSFTILAQAVLDIDANKLYRPLTDGLLVIRYLFDLEGPALTNGAIGANATRSDPQEVFDYLESIRPQLDIDLNGLVRPLTDGLLVIRYLFGLRGDALVANAVGAGAMRNTQQIEDYILSLMPVVP